jgi:hypothetical protein
MLKIDWNIAFKLGVFSLDFFFEVTSIGKISKEDLVFY